MAYDHRRHAGNAGDLWKHIVLAEVADRLFEAGVRVYVESHAGRPGYRLRPGGEWEGGIGRIWPIPEGMAARPYFQILAALNPQGRELYPGSASIVLHLARKRGFSLRAELWDTSPEVEASWRAGEANVRRQHVQFHLGDGFSGAGRLAGVLKEPALLLVDSPWTDPRDADLARGLISRAAEAGWVVLSWEAIDGSTRREAAFRRRGFDLLFEEAGLSGSGKGARMTLAWGDRHPYLIDDLIGGLLGIEEELPRAARRMTVRMSESF